MHGQLSFSKTILEPASYNLQKCEGGDYFLTLNRVFTTLLICPLENAFLPLGTTNTFQHGTQDEK
jgi:hypothetical protein